MSHKVFQPMLWPTLMAIPTLAVLVGLGVWQLERLRWKSDLIETVEARVGLAPVSFPGAHTWDNLDVSNWAFRPVVVRGRFDHSKRLYWFAQKAGGSVGFQVITPLRLEGEGGGWVLVDRGFVTQNSRDPKVWTEGEPEGVVKIIGLARASGVRSLFDPPDEPQNGLWFVRDSVAMGEALDLATVAPLFVDAERGSDSSSGVAPVPEGGQTPRHFRNAHLHYALTWFGLAVVLVGIYFVWHWQVGHMGRPRRVD
ncbi:MAG: SURF1 family protein [Parvularculales bacterium]